MRILSRRAIQAGILATTLMLGGFAATAPMVGAANTAGNLDPTFGKGGKVLVNLGGQPSVSDALVQTNGDIVVSGNFGLARFSPTGVLDTTFGQGGVAATGFGAGGLTQQPDGSFIVVAPATTPTGNDFGVARLTASGNLDQSFGSGGTVTTAFSSPQGASASPKAVLVQSDGKILVGGAIQQSTYRGSTSTGALARYNTNGSLDTTFAGGTLVLTSLSAVQSIGIDASGDIFVLSGSKSAFAELSSNGHVDTTVTPSALVATSHGGSNTFLAGGQAVVAQAVQIFRGDVDIQVQRLSANLGTVSTSPSIDYTEQEGSGRDGVNAVAIDSNGRAIVGGAHFLSTSVFGLARVNVDGSLDSSFGSGGTLTTTFQGNEGVGALVIQPDGKIVAIGYSEDNSTGQVSIALARYLAQ